MFEWSRARTLRAFGVVWLVWAAASTAGCESGDVGAPCVPDAEYSAGFAPFSLRELYLESSSLECATRLCLVNHFQGRVSCPFGQDGPDDERPCPLPGAHDESERVRSFVPAWDLDRPPSRAVYCSCRCAGPDPNARYCECPSGYECRALVPELGFENAQLVGSYCIKADTEFEPSEVGGATCADAPNDERCVD